MNTITIAPWMQAIADAAPESNNLDMRKVYRWKDYQLATDGHILVLRADAVEGLPAFPRKIDAWFEGEPRCVIAADAFRQFCNPAIYAAACPLCKGTCQRKCRECKNLAEFADKQLCEDCNGTGIEECWHYDDTSNYGFLKHVLFNRNILWKVLPHISDEQIRFALGGPKEMIRFDGDGWKVALMPVMQDRCSKFELEHLARFQEAA